jgi:hypothetical protein
MAAGKCPYCGGQGRKIDARVVGQPSHLTFGYGVRVWQCSKCGETWTACYPIPPKGFQYMPEPREGILRLTFRERLSGYASPIVLTATVSAASEAAGGEDAAE